MSGLMDDGMETSTWQQALSGARKFCQEFTAIGGVEAPLPVAAAVTCGLPRMHKWRTGAEVADGTGCTSFVSD